MNRPSLVKAHVICLIKLKPMFSLQKMIKPILPHWAQPTESFSIKETLYNFFQKQWPQAHLIVIWNGPVHNQK